MLATMLLQNPAFLTAIETGCWVLAIVMLGFPIAHAIYMGGAANTGNPIDEETWSGARFAANQPCFWDML